MLGGGVRRRWPEAPRGRCLLPNILDRPLQLPADADAGKSQICGNGHPTLPWVTAKERYPGRSTYIRLRQWERSHLSARDAKNGMFIANFVKPQRNRPCIQQLRNSSPPARSVTDGAWGTQLQQRGLPDRRLSRRLEPHPAGKGRRSRPRLRRGGQRDHSDQHVRGESLRSCPAWLGRQGGRDQPGRRGNFPPCRDGNAGRGLRLDRAQRRDADDGPGERSRSAGRLRRAGPGHRRRRGRRHRDRDHVRPGRSGVGRGRRHEPACPWSPA